MNLRVMTSAGEAIFEKYLDDLKQDAMLTKPNLNIEEYSTEYLKPCPVPDEISKINTRMELGETIARIFSNNSISRGEIIGNRGVWTWLAYIWIERLTPLNGESRKIRENYSYIYVPSYRRSYRHLVAFPYLLFTKLGKNLSKLFLECDLVEHNDFVEQLASSNFIISNLSIIEAAHKLYWNEREGKSKRGAQTRGKPGTLRRFTRVLGQLELNFDIYSESSNKILELLPGEFDKWRQFS